jgi:hypothetical protein
MDKIRKKKRSTVIYYRKSRFRNNFIVCCDNCATDAQKVYNDFRTTTYFKLLISHFRISPIRYKCIKCKKFIMDLPNETDRPYFTDT